MGFRSQFKIITLAELTGHNVVVKGRATILSRWLAHKLSHRIPVEPVSHCYP